MENGVSEVAIPSANAARKMTMHLLNVNCHWRFLEVPEKFVYNYSKHASVLLTRKGLEYMKIIEVPEESCSAALDDIVNPLEMRQVQ